MQKNYYLNIFHYQNYITKQYRKINSADPLSQAKYYLQAAQANIGNPIKFNRYYAYSVICQAKFLNTSQAWSKATIACAKAGKRDWLNYCYNKLQFADPNAIRSVRWQVILTSVQTNNNQLLIEETTKFSSTLRGRLWYIFFACATTNHPCWLNECIQAIITLDPSGNLLQQYSTHLNAYYLRQNTVSRGRLVNSNIRISNAQVNTIAIGNRQALFATSSSAENEQKEEKSSQATQNPRLS